MKKFTAKIDIEFMAKDLDDAFKKLEDHFYNLRTAKQPESLLDESGLNGKLEVKEKKS